MPLREDEIGRRGKDDLKYCVVCKQYLAPVAWAEHEHNPARSGRKPVAVAPKAGTLITTLVLGPCAIGNTSGVLVLEGLEVFRLRHRGEDGHISINLDVRGQDGKQLAKVERNSPLLVAPGLAFTADGAEFRLADATGQTILNITATESDTISLAGDLWANGVRLHIAPEALTLDGQPLTTTRLYGPGTAVLLRKGKGVAFAKS